MSEVVPPGRWPVRSGPAIDAEMSSLWGLLKRAPLRVDPDNDWQEAIEAQLSVLSELLTLSQTSAEFDAETTEDYIVRAALKASEWLRGVGEAPSEEWRRLLESKLPIYRA